MKVFGGELKKNAFFSRFKEFVILCGNIMLRANENTDGYYSGKIIQWN